MSLSKKMGNIGQFNRKVHRGYVAPEVTVVVFAAERGFDISTGVIDNERVLNFEIWDRYNQNSAGETREYGDDACWSDNN